MGQFKKFKLGSVIDLKRGYDLPQQHRKAGRIPIYSSAGLSGFHHEAKVKGPGVITGRYGTLGELFYTEQDYWPHNTTLYVRDFKGNYPKFIYYFLQTLGFSHQNDKTSVPGVNRNHLHEMDVFIPEDLATQKRIASILSSIDDKIELNHRTSQTMEEIAKTLFQKYFIQVIEPDDLPGGWHWGTLGDVSKNIRVSVNPKEFTIQSKYVGLEHIPRKSLALCDWGISDGLESQKYSFIENQILFGKLRPYFHKVVLAPFDGVCSTDILVIEPKELYQLSFCLFHYFSDEVVQHSNMFSDGTRMPRTNWETLSRYEIAIPPANLLIEFNDIVIPLLNKIKNNIKENVSLIQIRNSLLPKLMSGEIEVNVAEKELAEL